MTVLPFTARRLRSPRTGTARRYVPAVAVTGTIGSPDGRAGGFTGSYRLERCVSPAGQLAAAGVLTGRLTAADGRQIGIGARRTIVAVDAEVTAAAVLVRIGPLEVNLLGLLVSVHEFWVDVRGTSCERGVREALRLPCQPPATGAVAVEPSPCTTASDGSTGPASPREEVARPAPQGAVTALAAGERHTLLWERRLLLDVLALVRRCDGRPPVPLLDAVLNGTGAAPAVLPAQCRRR